MASQMENVCHCLWWHPQGAKFPSKPMEVLEQEAKNCRITAARTAAFYHLQHLPWGAGPTVSLQCYWKGRERGNRSFPQWEPKQLPQTVVLEMTPVLWCCGVISSRLVCLFSECQTEIHGEVFSVYDLFGIRKNPFIENLKDSLCYLFRNNRFSLTLQ